jgi:hypothetical protein
MSPAQRSSLMVGLVLLPLLARPAPAQEVIVESEAAARERSRSAAALLRPPGSDPYDSTDWRNVPAWRQTTFCGVRAQGTFFVYVVDCSGSMADANRWLRVRQELRRTIGALQFPQRYLVIFYNDRAWPMPGGLPESAGKKTAARTLAWASNFLPEGGTDPRHAMAMALGLKPDAVFLLSDGEYPDGTAEAIAATNRTAQVPIHCLDFSGGAAGIALKQIARDSGGQYAARSSGDPSTR